MDALTLSTAFKMVVSLGCVLLSFGAAVWVARKISTKGGLFAKKGSVRTTKPLEILSVQSLGPGKNIYLVRCLDRKILVGATSSQISHLANIEDNIDGEAFDDTFNGKLPAQSEKRMKEHFDTSLKDVSRV